MLKQPCWFSWVYGIALGGATMLAPHMARADLVSVAFNYLTAKYVIAGNHLTVLSQNGVLAAPSDFTLARLVAPTGAANIAFNQPHGVATFSLDMTLSNVTASSATAVGTLLIEDVDGDKLIADIIDGSWVNVGSFAFFGGTLSNVQMVSSGNGTFNGTSGSGFSMSFSQPSPYTGALVALFLQGWFTNSSGVQTAFDKQITNGSAQIVAICGVSLDGDNVGEDCDLCPNTIPGIEVDGEGCPPLIPGDTNRDGDVDAADLAVLRSCQSGPAVPRAQTATCAALDFDGDQDVDQDDFGRFQRCYSGEDLPANPNCAG